MRKVIILTPSSFGRTGDVVSYSQDGLGVEIRPHGENNTYWFYDNKEIQFCDEAFDYSKKPVVIKPKLSTIST